MFVLTSCSKEPEKSRNEVKGTFPGCKVYSLKNESEYFVVIDSSGQIFFVNNGGEKMETYHFIRVDTLKATVKSLN